MAKNVIVTGRGTARLAPDTATVELWLRSKNADYNEAAKALLKDSVLVEEAAQSTGLDVQVKGGALHVGACYEYRKDLAGNQKRVQVGYEASRSVEVSVPNKGANAIALQVALRRSGVTPDFTVSYCLREENAAENLALEMACADARKKAEVMCAAAGAQLGELVSISNTAVQAVAPPQPVMLRMAAADMDGDLNGGVEAEDIEVSAEVTLVYEFK